jgi:hypothetical protein
MLVELRRDNIPKPKNSSTAQETTRGYCDSCRSWPGSKTPTTLRHVASVWPICATLQQSGPVNTPCSGGRLKILWPAFRRLEIPQTIFVLFRCDNRRPHLVADLAPGTAFLRPATKRLNRPFFVPRDRLAHITRHTTPANTAFSREVSESAKFRECVVVCAARYEPVSTCNSLLSGKLTGNFAIFGLLEAISVRKALCRSHFSANSLRKLTGKIF